MRRVRKELGGGDSDSALLIACYGGSAYATQLAFESGALISTTDKCGVKAGYFAALSGDIATLNMLIDKDVHKEYTARWFDRHITSDDMSVLMCVIRHGLTDIYKFLIHEFGCQLLLVGRRFGKKDAALDNWLELIPEITNPRMILRRRPVTLANSTLDFDSHKSITESEYEKLKNRRAYAREFIRSYYKKLADRQVRSGIDESKASRGDVATISSTWNSLGKRRKALATAENASGVCGPSTKPVFEVIASVVAAPTQALRFGVGRRCALGMQTTEVAGGDGPGVRTLVWLCGQCSLPHCQELDRSKVLPCQGCEVLNLVRPRLLEADVHGKIDLEATKADMWENAGQEFQDEDLVDKYLPIFRGSIFWILGVHRLRELLRIVQVQTWVKGETIFKERDEVAMLCLLKQGHVSLTCGGQERQRVEVEEGLQLQLLDHRAFTIEGSDRGVHSSTAIVNSFRASAFIFRKAFIVDYACVDSLEAMVREVLSKAMISVLPEFKNTLKPREQDLLADVLEFMEYEKGDCLVAKGQRIQHLLLVQQGRITITDDTVTKEIVISRDRPGGYAGHSWHKGYVCGLRALLYDICMPMSVAVSDGVAHCWRLSCERGDKVLPDGMNVRRILQISTYIDHLLQLTIFKKLSKSDPRFWKMVGSLVQTEFWEGEDVIVQGDSGTSLFVLIEGTVTVSVNDKEVACLTADVDRRKVHYFGELAFLEGGKRRATVRMFSESGTLLEITAEIVNDAFGSVYQLLADQGETAASILKAEQEKRAAVPAVKAKKDQSAEVHKIKKQQTKVNDAIVQYPNKKDTGKR